MEFLIEYLSRVGLDAKSRYFGVAVGCLVNCVSDTTGRYEYPRRSLSG
jgi:hypothetical protein